MSDIAKKADIVFGVKSAYEKTGVYVNAMRRLHLSQPIIQNNLPDDWEVLKDIENKIKGEFLYQKSEDVWNDVRIDAPYRFGGASYLKLIKHRSKGMQWPVNRTDTPILHTKRFRTKDGLGYFIYHQYSLRGQIKELLKNKKIKNYYLTTGRTIVHYNNAIQTNKSEALLNRHTKDIVQISIEDKDNFKSTQIVLKNKYGQTSPLNIKFVKTLKKGTMFCTFHHINSKINYIFSDKADTFTQTARFKSTEVKIEQI
jgi:formate dehydrogenase major subunit